MGMKANEYNRLSVTKCVSLPVPAIQVCVWMTHSHCDADSLPPQSLISNFNWKPEPQLFCSGSKSESILMLLVRAHVKLGGHGWPRMSKTGPDTMFSSGHENTKMKWRLIWGHFILFIKMQFYERYRLDTARGSISYKQCRHRTLWGSSKTAKLWR